MKLNKERRDRLILVGLVTAALGVAIWLLFVKAGMRRLAAARKAAELSLSEFQKAEAFLKQAGEFEMRSQELSNRLVSVEAQMANRGDLLAWSFELVKQATSGHEGVVIEEIVAPRQPSAVQMIPSFPYQAMSFTVRGNAYFSDLGEFLADFENSYPYYRTENLELRLAPGAIENAARTSRQKLSFRVDFVALVQPSS